VQPLICVVYNKLVITIRLMFKTSSVRQLLHCGSTTPGPQNGAEATEQRSRCGTVMWD